VLFVGIPLTLLVIAVRVAIPSVATWLERRLPQMEIRGTPPPKPAVAIRWVSIVTMVASAMLLWAPTFILAIPIYAWLDMPWACIEAVWSTAALVGSSLAILTAVVLAMCVAR